MSSADDAPRVDFSYTVFWTKQVRQWTPTRRAAVEAALAEVLRRPDFELNAYERRYRVPGLDEDAPARAHAGASLAALAKVLKAFAEQP